MNKEVKYTRERVLSEDMVLPEYGRKRVSRCFVKQYLGVLGQVYHLSKSANNFLQYMVYKMNDDGIVNVNSHLKEGFNVDIQQYGVKKYSSSALDKAVKELTEKKFLIKERRGIYLINPEYFDRGTEDDRLVKIQMLLEFEAGSRAKLSIKHRYDKEAMLVTNSKTD